MVISFVCLVPVLQKGGFVPREWLAAKGLLRRKHCSCVRTEALFSMTFVPAQEVSGVVWTRLKWRRKSVFNTLSLRFFMVDLFFRLDGLLRLSPRPAGESYVSLLSYLLGKIGCSIQSKISWRQLADFICIGKMISGCLSQNISLRY